MSDTSGGQAAGWYPDPTGRHQYRYWDGGAWTDHISDAGVAGTDPVGGPGQSFAPTGSEPAPGGGPVVEEHGSRAPLFIALGAVGLLVLGAILFFTLGGDDDDDGGGGGDAEGIAAFSADVPDGGFVTREVSLPENSVLLVSADPEDDFDVALGITSEDAGLVQEYEDFFDIRPDDLEGSYDDLDDQPPGTVLDYTDPGGGGDVERTFVPAPSGGDFVVVVSGYQGEGGQAEVDLTVEEFDGPDNGDEYINELLQQEFMSDFGGGFTDFSDFSDFTDFSDFSDFTDPFSDFSDFTDFSDPFSDFSDFTDFSDPFSDLSDFSDLFTDFSDFSDFTDLFTDFTS